MYLSPSRDHTTTPLYPPACHDGMPPMPSTILWGGQWSQVGLVEIDALTLPASLAKSVAVS